MSLRVIGAGLPRTGTATLKQSLERLLGGPCYHMFELQQRVEEDGGRWWEALAGEHDRLDALLEDWVAAVDWPASIFWKELAERHPDALVVLSHRGSSETWWASADATVWQTMRHHLDGSNPVLTEFNRAMRERAGMPHDLAATGARARYEAHYAEVVATIPAERLLVWQPSDGWEPLCERLGVEVPDDEAIHTNTCAEFVSRMNNPRT